LELKEALVSSLGAGLTSHPALNAAERFMMSILLFTVAAWMNLWLLYIR